MDFRAIGAAIAIATGCSDADTTIESARKRILALDAHEAAKIVVFCQSWRLEGGLSVDQFPSALPVSPTSASADAGVLTFVWWNNDHRVETAPHPGFQLICSDHAITDARVLAPGLWYRDTPMHGS